MISSIELTVLGLISYKPMHGYKLCHFFENKGIDVLKEIKKPSVYAILKRFEKQELIIGEYEFDENNPPRKVYSITDDGKKYFRENLREYLMNYSSFNPIGFWHLLRFSENNLTKEEFTIAITHMKQEIISHISHFKGKKNLMLKEATASRKQFYQIIKKMVTALNKENLKALDEYNSFAENPENASFFFLGKEDK